MSSDTVLKPPFPWFGGKSRIASLAWKQFGNVANYVEPFFGSGAVLFGRPHEPKVETVNDLDCYLANFWRALQHDPDGVTQWADWPVNEADLHARHLWLVGREEFREQMHADPDYYDVKIAGWWVWGICQWIGSGWCAADTFYDDRAQLPHLGDPGRGIHRPSAQLPHLGNPGRGLYEYMAAISERLRRVRICCGDWARVLGPSVTTRLGTTAVFLDPPYAHDDRADVYSMEDYSVAHDVQAWAIEHGDDPLLRIALCGYEPLDMPAGWSKVNWKAAGGFASQGNGSGRENCKREVVWFSPHCKQQARQLELAAIG